MADAQFATIAVLVGISIVAVSDLQAQSAPKRAVTQNGVMLLMPDIDGLDCPERSLLLNEYMVSAYRGIDPLPDDHPDRWIFEYENKLAQSYFLDCANDSSEPIPAIEFSGRVQF